MNRDLTSNIKSTSSIVPAVQAATINGTGVDLRGFDSAAVVVHTGAIVGAGDFTAVVQESDDNSAYTEAPAAAVQGTFPATLLADSVYEVGYVGSKRYARARLVKAGGTSIAASAVVIAGRPAAGPV